MTTIQLTKGETDRLVSRQDARDDKQYVLRVLKGTVRLEHEKRYVEDGDVYQKNDQGRLRNLNGRELYIYAEERSIIEFSEDTFFFELFGNSTVNRPSDRGGVDGSASTAAAEDNYRVVDESYTLTSGGSQTQTIENKTDGEAEVIEAVSVGVDGVNPEQVWSDVLFYGQNAGKLVDRKAYGGSFVLDNLETPYPPDAALTGDFNNNDGSNSQTVALRFTIRSEE